MHALTAFALSFSFLTASAQFAPAQPVEIAKRAPYAGGGWAYNTGADCPVGTKSFGDVNIDVCCPIGFAPEGSAGPIARACCPTGSSCLTALQAIPFCADSSWVLWNATTQDAGHQYFCCLQGQIGLQDESCVSGASNVAATLSAVQLGQPVPTGAAGVTLSASVGTGSITSGGSSATGTSTSKGGFLGSIVSSAITAATAHSDSSRTRPLAADIPGRMFGIGSGMAVAGIVTALALVARLA